MINDPNQLPLLFCCRLPSPDTKNRSAFFFNFDFRFDYILLVVKSVLTKIHVKMITEIDGNSTNIVHIHR